MSRCDEPVDPGTLHLIAGRILDHHAAGGTCQRCTPADCDQTAWALEIWAADLARRAAARVSLR